MELLSQLKSGNILSTIKLLFQKQTEQGAERSRVLLLTSIISLFSKGISFLILIVSVPLTINYLGTEKFGFLSTLVSTFSIMAYSDLGMGMGLQNSLPSYIANNQSEKVRKTISTTFYFLLAVATVLFLCFFIATLFIDWTQFFNVKDGVSRQEANASILVLVLITCVAIPATLIQRIQNAYQIGYISEIWITIGNIVGLLGLFVVTYFRLDLPWIFIVMQGVVNIFFIVNFCNAILIQKRFSIPNLNEFDKKIFIHNLKFGFSYLILALCGMLVNSIDNFLIGNQYGMKMVAEYTIGFRLISFFYMPIQIFTAPLLAAYNDAWVRNDGAWLRKIFFRYLKWISLITLFSLTIIIVFGNQMIQLWIGNSSFSTYQLIMLGVLLIYLNFNAFFSMIGLSRRFVKYLLKIYPVAVGVSLALKIYLLNHFSEYINIVWATFFSMTLLFFVPIIIKIYKEDFK
jgi:O-antigen/teichoic acid export membrane protein